MYKFVFSQTLPLLHLHLSFSNPDKSRDKFGKANKLDMLNSAIGKEKYIYVFASKNISEKYKMAYLNVKNLDCIAISDIDVDKIDEE